MSSQPVAAPANRIEDAALSHLLTLGGDERILIDPAAGLNRYNVRPVPDDAISYSSSTANTISYDAFMHCGDVLARYGGIADPASCAAVLDGLRGRIARVWGLNDTVSIVFAASGTDLEYAGIAAAWRGAGIDNILIGADEVGSGCVNSASGRYFAATTPLGVTTKAGEPVAPEFPDIRLVDLPVRCDDGQALPSADVTAQIADAIDTAIAADRRPLVHVLHGSKTGLVLPELHDLDRLISRFGDAVSFVVDACQVRISSEMIRAYLDRGCTVFLTGSKFVGGPPFNGFALVPAKASKGVCALPSGFATLSARAEWPAGWPGRDALPDIANPGLALRLAASLFEIERFLAQPHSEVVRIISAFEAAVDSLAARLGGVRMTSPMSGRTNGGIAVDEMRTLATLDLRNLSTDCDEAETRRIYNAMARPEAGAPIRLGQPVKCVRLDNGEFGGTLRLGLSMPQMVAFAALSQMALEERLSGDMTAIAARIMAIVTKP